MNEVEKMYKTIFGEFAPNCSLCVKFIDCEIINNTYNCNKFQCDYKRLFTAEKQLKLIKWLMNYDEIHGDYNDEEYGFATLNYSGKYKKDFEESLASVINNELWQDLTDADKAQIKEILE